jgi:hypothetical protein
VPGVRAYLIAEEYVYGVDYRLDRPALVRIPTLDALEAGEPVVVAAWELPESSAFKQAALRNLDRQSDRVSVDDEVVTLLERRDSREVLHEEDDR